MYKILTFTPAWQRPEILEIHLKGVKRLQNYKPHQFKIQPFYMVSESAAAKLVMKYGFDFIFVENQPLGRKKNTGLYYALQNFDFDYIMELGSDDLAANNYLDFIQPEFEARTPQFHPDVYFICTQSGKTAYWFSDKILGAGRCISRRAIESVTRKGIDLWTATKNRGMDTCSWKNLLRMGTTSKPLPPSGIFTLDIKSEVNINQIMPFKPSPAPRQQILAAFPGEAPDILQLITKNK